MKEGCGRQNGMKMSLLTFHASVCNTTMVGFESGDTVEKLRYASSHWSCTGYYGMRRYWISLSHSSSKHCGTLNSQSYISEVLEPVVLPYLQGLATAIFQQDNARPHMACIVQRFFVNYLIELLLWPARSPGLTLIKTCGPWLLND
ncbi:transposable element Tcb1 transposase [Trichonephila clavipes]|nr:transposable element Tcb1 transposase [Trichonephila clavipes]